MKKILFPTLFGLLGLSLSTVLNPVYASYRISDYDVVWDSQSHNSSESMPCGGGDLGMNVWVEDGQLLFYVTRSNSFDENNTMLKAGRIRLSLDEPLDTLRFSQRLNLKDGCVEIRAGRGRHRADIRLWSDLQSPSVQVSVRTAARRRAVLSYESWRSEERFLRKNEGNQNSYKWAPPKGMKVKADSIWTMQNPKGRGEAVCFRRLSHYDIYDAVLAQQQLEPYRDRLYNPFPDEEAEGRPSEGIWLEGLLYGPSYRFSETSEGVYVNTPFKAWNLEGKASRRHDFCLQLFAREDLQKGFEAPVTAFEQEGMKSGRTAFRRQQQVSARYAAGWWNDFWDRSHLSVWSASGDEDVWKIGRNYQLFRYQLGCNAQGNWPTRFNGGLFTYDPVFVNPQRAFTPDFRNWGGGTFTAQNQRLVYFPMLMNGDADLLRPQLEFYRRNLVNAEQRSEIFWGHPGASFTEQIELFGLPNPSEYGWKRPEGFDPALEYNKWLEYLWDTALEFCHMAFLAADRAGMDISEYIPLTESVLTFFDEHYRMLAEERGEAALDAQGHIRIYPGSACETYKLADNPSSTVAGLRVLTAELADYFERNSQMEKADRWNRFLHSLPEIPLSALRIGMGTDSADVPVIAPAISWDRINNTEAPQLYPVWPWRLYSSQSADKEVAINTYLYDEHVRSNYSHVGWKQYNIFAACLGMTEEAEKLARLKWADADTRFPTFWGPGFDWTPDHNWGGSAMIGLQEMIMCCQDGKILLFPAWPSDWNVDFKLHAARQTLVEGRLENGELKALKVTPESRLADVVNLLDKQP